MLRWRLWHSTEYRHGARLHPRRDSGKQTLIKTWPALAVAVTRSPTLPFTCSPGPCVPAVRGLNPLHRHERADSQEGRPGPHPNTEVLMRACGSFTRLRLPDTMLSNDASADLCMVASGRHRGNEPSCYPHTDSPPHAIPSGPSARRSSARCALSWRSTTGPSFGNRATAARHTTIRCTACSSE